MGQTESAAAPRRADPRWARVALAQLRDEAFLDQQRRRLETIAGARQASGAHRCQRTRRGLFADAPASGERAVWTTLLLKSKDHAAQQDTEQENAGDARLTAQQRAQLEDAEEDELVNALVLLGDLPQPKRAAFLLCHLEDQLAKLCNVVDPVADVVALRRQILRDVLDAVAVQQHHYKAATVAFQATVEIITRMKAQTIESQQKTSAWASKTSAEAMLASSFVTELLSGLLDACAGDLHSSRRDLFREIASLIETVTPQSLVVRTVSALEADPRVLVRKLHRFLLAVVREDESHFDLADRTLAMKCLIQLAVASASAGDLLVVVSVLLGVGDGSSSVVSAASLSSQVPSPPKSVRSSCAPSPPRVKSARSPKREQIHVKDLGADGVVEDERIDPLDEVANIAVEQRLKQVHKQRVDQGVKGELDGQTTVVDQLLSSHAKRKAGAKSLVVVHTKTAVANVTVSNASSSITVGGSRGVVPQPPPHTSRLNLKAVKDDFNNLSLETDINFSLDATSSRSDTTTARSPRHHVPSTMCVSYPKFLPLCVGSVLKEIDLVKPTFAFHQRQRKTAYPDHSPTNFRLDLDGSEHDHEVWSCGQNSYGELGHGDSTSRKTFERIEALQQKDIVCVSAGNEHTIVLSADGTVWTCGYNDNGQCGLGVTTRVNHLTELQKLGDAVVTQVHAYNGCEHTIMVTQDGRAASCGYNYRGQLGHGNTQSESLPKIIRSVEGKLVRLVSCSYYHTVITCDSGPAGKSQVYTFGRNDYGQLGHSDTIDRKIPQCVEPLHDQHIVSVACGQYHTMVVTSSGKLYAFGKNDYGQLGVDTVENQPAPVHVKHGLERQTCLDVRCGYYHSIVLCAGAHLFGFGRNDYGQLGLGKASNSLAANMQLQQQRFAKPVILEDLEGKEIVRFACGCYHTIAVSDNGILYVFGRNNHGQLGTGDTSERYYPYPIDDFVGKRVALVAAGFYHTLVLTGGKEDEVDGEHDFNYQSQDRDANILCEKLEQSQGSVITSSTILATSSVKELFENRIPQTSKLPPPHLSASSRLRLPGDHSIETETDDGRTEDQTGLVSGDGIFSNILDASASIRALHRLADHDNSSTTSTGRSSATNDSIDIAIVILAQLDRLSTPYLAKRGSVFPASQQLPMSGVDRWFKSEMSVVDILDGLFDPYAICASAPTLSTLSQLISQISSRRLDAFVGSHIGSELAFSSAVHLKSTNQSVQLQIYLLVACIRILRANVLQVARSGLASLLLAVKYAKQSPGSGGAHSQIDSLDEMGVSVERVRNVLVDLITKADGTDVVDTSQAPIANNSQVTTEAIETLVAGIDIFFPCQCSRTMLLVCLLDTGTQLNESVCDVGKELDWARICTKSSQAKRRLLLALLNQFSDDTFIVKLLPIVGSGECLPDSSGKRAFESFRRLVEKVFERLHGDFLDNLGQMPSSDATQEAEMPTESSAYDPVLDALVVLVDGILKHLASDASVCKRWTKAINIDSSKSLSNRVSLLVSQAFCATTGDVEGFAGSFPKEWQCYAEVALRILSLCTNILLRALSYSTASPTCSSKNATASNSSARTVCSVQLSRILERSAVGTLLPVLLDSLEAFAYVPALAVSFILPLRSLLDLLDQWNFTNADIKRCAELDMSCRLASTLATTDSLPPSGRRRQSGLSAKPPAPTASVDTSASGTPFPWSLRLEKELALVCAGLVVTVTRGDPLIMLFEAREDCMTSKSSDFREGPDIRRWRNYQLFKGGLSSDFVHKTLFVDSALSRSICYLPPLHAFQQDKSLVRFALTLPPLSEVYEDCNNKFGDAINPYACLRKSSGRQFIAQMAKMNSSDDVDMQPLVKNFCEWIRQSHTKKDTAYRMLIRQSQNHAKFRVENADPSDFNDSELEELFFAALLHHHTLWSFALLVAVGRFVHSTALNALPPNSLAGLWSVVADFRKRIVAKRTAIKNAQDISDPQRHVYDFQREVVQRGHLMMLLSVDGEDEHQLRLLDGGFVAPWDPAYSFRSCLKADKSLGSGFRIRSHLSAQYGVDALPFLHAYPASRWRRVRTLFHVVARWKYAVISAAKIHMTTATSGPLEFITADRSEVGDVGMFAYRLLVEPCRQFACSTRGFEILWDILRKPRLETVRVCFLGQLARALQQSLPTSGTDMNAFIHANCASFAYREMQRNAQNDFLSSLTQMMLEKTALIEGSSAEISSSQSTESVLLVLLRCLSLMHFEEDQYDFVNDLELVKVLLQLQRTENDSLIESQPTGSQNDSIRAIEMLSSRAMNASLSDVWSPRVLQAVWALARSVVLHFGLSSPREPIYPSSFDVFTTLQHSGNDFLRLTNNPLSSAHPFDPPKHTGSSVNTTIRRSFEIIVSPRRFSFLTRGLTFPYKQMIEPASGLLAMSPLIKPSEFSITTWMYAASPLQSETSDTSELDPSVLEEKQIVFVRGGEREISPYLLLSRDIDSKWQLEVGVAVHVAHATALTSTRLLWERITTKESVPTRKWTHVAIVMEGAKLRLYINGVLDSQRSLSGPLAVAVNNGSVDLDFCFGRKPPIEIPPSGDEVGSRERSRAPIAMEFLSALLSASSATSKSLMAVNSTDATTPVRSFHGLLSHFRFHNRSLSPIHVRIIFDEKKLVKEDELNTKMALGRSPESAFQILQLHSVLRVMVESDEGRAHLADVSWTYQLMEIVLSCRDNVLVMSSLQLLRQVLVLQPPNLVESYFQQVRNIPQREFSFVHHLLYIIGVCLSPCVPEVVDFPIPAILNRSQPIRTDLGSSIELRNSTAERMLEEDSCGPDAIALANELTITISTLAQQKRASLWHHGIWRVIDSVLLVNRPVGDTKGHSWFARLGSLYLLGGISGALVSGSEVEIAGTRDRATVIAVDDNTARPPQDNKRQRETRQPFVYVSIHGESEQMDKSLSWHDQVTNECGSFRRLLAQAYASNHPRRHPDEATGHNDDVPFVRVHRDDVECAPSPGISFLTIGNAFQVDTPRLLCNLLRELDVDHSCDAVSGIEQLSSWLDSGLLMKSLVQLTSNKSSSHYLLQDRDLTLKLLELSTRDDGSLYFRTLADAERRLSIVRTRVYQALRDLQDHGDVEVLHWIRLKMSKRERDAKTASEILEEEVGDDKPETALQSELAVTHPDVKLDLRLDLEMDDPSVDVDMSSPASGGSSSAGDDGDPTDESDVRTDFHARDIAGDGSDGDDDEEDEVNDDDEEDGDEDEDDEEAAEHRQEFVDELMMMGFPEEWCVLALKQTENDIVSASAWIVDNLEYLSRLQTSLDNQRDQRTDNLAVQDEDDDDGAPAPKDEPDRSVSSPAARQDANRRCHSSTPVRSDYITMQLINDKEMGRKIFGELYFPFDDGGFQSNMKDHFLSPWRSEKHNPQQTTTSSQQELGEDGLPLPQISEIQKPMDTVDRFTKDIMTLELHDLLDILADFERMVLILMSRQVVINLLISRDREKDDSVELINSPLFMKFMKLVLFRGDQFGLRSTVVDEAMRASLHQILALDEPEFIEKLLDFALGQVELAGSGSAFDAYLWTHRELARTDRAVLSEPAVELAIWLIDIVFKHNQGTLALTVDAANSIVCRLRHVLRSTNLPVKFIAITTISRILDWLRQSHRVNSAEDVLAECRRDIGGFVHAAESRFIREQVQHRVLFSLYLQAYVEILLLLKPSVATDGETRALVVPPPIASSCLVNPNPPQDPNDLAINHPLLRFDQKKSRSSLLQISEDGLTVAYSGNEMWKTVVATQSFATGAHEWHIRVDKSPSSYLFIGVATRRANLDSFLGADDQSWGFIGDKGLYYQRNRLRVYGESFGEGDVVGVHLNCEIGVLSFSKNGQSLGVAFENVFDEVFPAVAFYSRHQKVTVIQPESNSDTVADENAFGTVQSDGTVEEAVLACEMMEFLTGKSSLSLELYRSAREMTVGWWNGTGKYVVTRAGGSLWVDVTKEVCNGYGFQADERVRSPRGNGRVLGVADGRLWIEVDGESGAWHIHPSRLRTMTLSVSTLIAGHDKSDDPTDQSFYQGTAKEGSQPSARLNASSLDSLTETEFRTFVQDRMWSAAFDRALLVFINGHCESTSTSPWNVSPQGVLRIVREKAHDIEHLSGGVLNFDEGSSTHCLERKILARFGFLRYFNAYLRRVVGFFDSTWLYFSPKLGLLPAKLLSACRGSVFTSIKNEFFTALMDKTSNSPKKSDDDYDYPEDLTQMMINRPKAATAKCHPGATRSLLLSMFGQAFEELHFLPLRMLRMVYSHPMDDGQLRSFKVKFEGEGVDDYGGPYREFFSQFFADLQMLSGDDETQPRERAADKDAKPGASFLPFLMPSPNWRNGVGSNREKFVLNGGLLSSTHAGSARVLQESTSKRHSRKRGWCENPELRRQLLSEMCHFLGQMIGIALRTRVCVRLDLAMSVWKQLVGEEDVLDEPAARERVLQSLKEIDHVSHALIKTLYSLHERYSQSTDPSRRAELEDELAAMDLSFTTYLSDGRLVELCDNGSDIAVTMDNVSRYLDLVLEARTSESQEVVNVIKQGIHSVIPVAALSLLTWEELEKRICGVAEVDVELLKGNTEYDEDLSANDEFIQRFWRVLSAMEDEDKRAFLRFVWARSRLPVGTAQFHQKFKIQSLAPPGAGDNASNASAANPNGYADGQLPKSHTCFFALQLPRYSSDDVCRKQLLYAIHNCVEMDGDFRLADTEMTGWTEINPNDQLRF